MIKERPLSSMMLLAYAFPAMAFAIPILTVITYIPQFYRGALAIEFFAIILAVGFCSDLVVGLLSDKLKLPRKIGRRKPWVVTGAVSAAIILYILFSTPDVMTSPYFLPWSIMLSICSSMIWVPYFAWGAELSDTYDGRTRITVAREAAAATGILLAAIIPILMSAVGLGEASTDIDFVWMAITLGLPSLILLVFLVPERHEPKTGPKARRGFGPSRSVFLNGLFIRLYGAWFLNGVATALPILLLPLYIRYILETPAPIRNTYIFLFILAAAISLPIWLKVSRSGAKYQTWRLVLILTALAYLTVPLLGRGDVINFGIICIIAGIALGADLAIPSAMQADVIDADRIRTGEERAGLFFAISGMTSKLALGTAIVVAIVGLDYAEFNWIEQNSIEAEKMLVFLYALVPVGLKTVAVLLLFNYPLTRKRQEALRRRLERRGPLSRKRTVRRPTTAIERP